MSISYRAQWNDRQDNFPLQKGPLKSQHKLGSHVF